MLVENPRRWRAYAGFVALWICAFALALRFGAAGSSADLDLVLSLRLPRALLASAVGAGLALAGAVLQAVFANPLCEPYTLGISSGSALGAVLGLSLGLDVTVSGLTGSAFAGALVFALGLHAISLKRGVGGTGLLLSGVMLGFLGSSLVAVWMAFADPNGIQAAVFWLMGDLSRARLRGATIALVTVAALAAAVWVRARELDAFLLGEENAAVVGIDVGRSRRRFIILASLLTGLSVSAGGMIGFVGLVIPYFGRRVVGSTHRALLPITALGGAAALTLGDTLARVVAQPYELPVGVMTALVGAPVFLWILLSRRGAE